MKWWETAYREFWSVFGLTALVTIIGWLLVRR